MVVITFVCLQKINNFPKFGGCGSKIEPATPIWNSKLDWAWQAQFLSHIHEFLQNYLFFKDLQMILVSFFEIFDGFWSTKKLPSLLLHVNQDLLVLVNNSERPFWHAQKIGFNGCIFLSIDIQFYSKNKMLCKIIIYKCSENFSNLAIVFSAIHDFVKFEIDELIRIGLIY